MRRFRTIVLATWFLSFVALLVALLPVRGGEKKDEKPHWSYSGKDGPENWYMLSPKWAIAKVGKRQSPINLSSAAKKVAFPAPKLNYQATPLSILNNGHTIEVLCVAPSLLTAEGKTYQLKQFHFHTPSEHQIDGKGYPMEVHLVHVRQNGEQKELLVLGIFMKPGKANPMIQKIWDLAPKTEGMKITDDRVNPLALLPTGKYQLYRYDGSLTTPPCAEVVRWYVYSTPAEVSVEQIKTFQKFFPVNARPVQPSHDRLVEVSGLLG